MSLYLTAFFKGARFHTLPALWVPVAMAAAWAFKREGNLDTTILIFTFLSGTFIQLAVNFFNDALDFSHGEDRADRKGPKRITQTGLASFKTVMIFGFFSCVMAVLLAVPLLLKGGWPILVLGAFSLSCAYFYSGTSFAFTRTGASDFFVVLFFGLGAVSGTYYLQTLKWNGDLIYLGLQCGFWALSLLVINHLRDEAEDKKSGRRNVVTFYGRDMGLLELVIAQSVIYLLCFYWLNKNGAAGAFSFLTLPLTAILIYFVCVTKPSAKYNKFLAFMSLLYSLFGGLWIFGTVFF